MTKKKLSERRYCIERLTHYDPDKKIETWKQTSWCDDKVDVLESLFLSSNTRIFDKQTNKEVRRNVDLSEWTKYRNK